MKPWMILFPRASREVPITGGQQARERAEQELARVRSETPYYEGLGRELRALRERNHIAENLRATLLRGV